MRGIQKATTEKVVVDLGDTDIAVEREPLDRGRIAVELERQRKRLRPQPELTKLLKKIQIIYETSF